MSSSAERAWAVDTSVALAALDESHDAHRDSRAAVIRHRPVLAGHATFETFSVLTRLPGALRVPPDLARRVIRAAFPSTCWLSAKQHERLVALLDSHAIIGGAVYDALVGYAASVNGRVLLTGDARAQRTYRLLGVEFELVGV